MEELLNDGEFFVGANYWASHSGTNMWTDWRPDIIENDFKLLSEAKIKILRVFPLWSEFQPLKMHKGWSGLDLEIRMGEERLPFTEAGQAGISEVMIERFDTFLKLAEKYDIKLVVGLITGWMSGRYYVPQIFENVNVLTDAGAIKWEIKYVRYMVKRFKNSKSIVAWDLGNECNCLGILNNKDEAYLWASAITMAIKMEDREHDVISGMHGSFPESNFCAKDLGEILDVLCTHPYPLFTDYCATDPICETKSVMHASCETVMYRGLSRKPAFAEEVGTLGNMIASNENTRDYINSVLYLLWADNCLGFMWWCAFDQDNLLHTPYDLEAYERELGLFCSDCTPKPVLSAITDFANFTENFKYEKLPRRIFDAVCIVNAKNDTWKSAYGTYVLAKEAGLDIEFCYVEDEIPDARAYILPSVEHANIKKSTMDEILKKVQNGAILYISLDGGVISSFEKITGIVPQCRYNQTKPDEVKLDGDVFNITQECKIDFVNSEAEVLACDQNGNTVMSKNQFGKGIVYFLAYGIENIAATTPKIMSGNDFIPYYKFYSKMEMLKNPERKVCKDNPFVSVTEHISGDTEIIVAVNTVPKETEVTFDFDGFKLKEVLNNQENKITVLGTKLKVMFKPNRALVFGIEKIQ